MKIKVLLVSSTMLCFAALSHSATAQTLSLKVDDGVVTLQATDVTVDDILARWSKITGLTVVSQDGRGSRVPVTLHVSGVSEREALGLVLRDLSGYIMGERQDPQTGAIRIDRLVILTDSAAKPSDAGPPARRQPPPAAQAPPDQGEDVPRELAP